MTEFATKLQGNVRFMYDVIEKQGHLIDGLKAERTELSSENETLKNRNAELQSRLNRALASGKNRVEMYDRQVEYMRDLKLRLTQTEKALRDASCRSESHRSACALLLEVTKSLVNSCDVTEQVKTAMERGGEQFMASGRLTPDDEMQRVLDELTSRAPDFKQGVAN